MGAVTVPIVRPGVACGPRSDHPVGPGQAARRPLSRRTVRSPTFHFTNGNKAGLRVCRRGGRDARSEAGDAGAPLSRVAAAVAPGPATQHGFRPRIPGIRVSLGPAT